MSSISIPSKMVRKFRFELTWINLPFHFKTLCFPKRRLCYYLFHHHHRTTGERHALLPLWRVMFACNASRSVWWGIMFDTLISVCSRQIRPKKRVANQRMKNRIRRVFFSFLIFRRGICNCIIDKGWAKKYLQTQSKCSVVSLHCVWLRGEIELTSVTI